MCSSGLGQIGKSTGLVLRGGCGHFRAMIERSAQQGLQMSRAWYSDCLSYRYGLERVWAEGPLALFIMLNPSTATEEANDPTIERCQRRAHQLGFSGLRIANLFAYRATAPKDLRRAPSPEGPENAAFVDQWFAQAPFTLAGWGAHGGLHGKGRAIAQRLTGSMYHIGLTKHGHPRHPLYVSYAVQPILWPLHERYLYADENPA